MITEEKRKKNSDDMADPTADYGKKKKTNWRLGGAVLASILGLQVLAVATKVPTKKPEQRNVVENIISVRPLRAPLRFLESPQSDFYASFWEHHTTDEKKQLFDFYEARNTDNPYSLADYALIASRITQGTPSVQALSYLERAILTNKQGSQLGRERLAFLKAEAYNDFSGFFDAARDANEFKQDIYSALGEEREVKVRFADEQISYHLDVPKDASRVVLGTSKIVVEDGVVIGTQVERVTRDWYGMNIPADPEHTVSVDKILNYHEGARTKDILSIIEGELKPLTGTLVAKRGSGWYAPDENGIFKFEVLPDKVQYPTSVKLEELALLSDTHGISSLVPQAIKQGVDLVVGCGDYIGKMQAANHLANKGIDVYFPCDRFVCDVIGYEGSGTLIGSGPVNEVDGKAVIGDQPLTINLDERIIVQNTEKLYPAQYYDAGRRYFEMLEKRSGIDFDLVRVNVDDLRETYKVVDKARELGSHVIAARVAYEEDYEAVKTWLEEDNQNRAVLLHTTAYDPGNRIMHEFPEQTTFGDPRPIFK